MAKVRTALGSSGGLRQLKAEGFYIDIEIHLQKITEMGRVKIKQENKNASRSIKAKRSRT
jgi:hypothetical protein